MYGTVDSNDTVYHDTARAPLESGGVYTEKWCRRRPRFVRFAALAVLERK